MYDIEDLEDLILYYFGLDFDSANAGFENLARLFIHRQINYLEFRDDFEDEFLT